MSRHFWRGVSIRLQNLISTCTALEYFFLKKCPNSYLLVGGEGRGIVSVFKLGFSELSALTLAPQRPPPPVFKACPLRFPPLSHPALGVYGLGLGRKGRSWY